MEKLKDIQGFCTNINKTNNKLIQTFKYKVEHLDLKLYTGKRV